MAKIKSSNNKQRRHQSASDHDGRRVSLFKVSKITPDGEIWIKRKDGVNKYTKAKEFRLMKEPDSGPALRQGQMLLASLQKDKNDFLAIAKRALPFGDKTKGDGREKGENHSSRPKQKEYALIEKNEKGLYLQPISRSKSRSFFVKYSNIIGLDKLPQALEDKDIINYQTDDTSKKLRINARIGKADEAQIFSLLSIYHYGLREEFPDEVIDQAKSLKALSSIGNREDFTHLPFVTIDDETAKDFDDAVMAEGLKNGGHRLYIAIADVAFYVRENSPLDQEARIRGNSVYFPDRVLPMLPEILSNDLCSLKSDQVRPCLCAVIDIDKDGDILSYEFHRVKIKSKARLTYNQVEDALYHGKIDDRFSHLLQQVLLPLKQAWDVLFKAREKRHALAILSSEVKVILNDEGIVEDLQPRRQLHSHRLIEDFMIAANVAAAKFLSSHQQKALYRIHEPPPADKLESLWEDLTTAGLKIPKSFLPTTQSFNHMIHKLADETSRELVSMAILRSQSQACYDEELSPHFGLALTHYTHFTSPIRRYSDLVVHRAIIHKLWQDEQIKHRPEADLGKHLSICERQAQMAERDAIGRYQSHFLKKYEDDILDATVTGIKPFGVFVRLNETGAEGLALFSSDHPDKHKRGKRQRQTSSQTYKIGDKIKVMIRELTPLAGGILFKILSPK